MITEGEKKYLEHAIELAEYIDQQNMTGNLKSEILDKMLIPYGLSDEKRNAGQQKSTQDQPKQPQPKTDSVMDLVKRHKELEVKGDKVVVSRRMDKQDFFDSLQEMKNRGWKYVEAKHIGGEKWEPGYFETGARA